jgi:hypothetical protein
LNLSSYISTYLQYLSMRIKCRCRFTNFLFRYIVTTFFRTFVTTGFEISSQRKLFSRGQKGVRLNFHCDEEINKCRCELFFIRSFSVVFSRKLFFDFVLETNGRSATVNIPCGLSGWTEHFGIYSYLHKTQ